MGPWILLVSSVVPAAGQAEPDDPNALRGQIIVRPGQPTWLRRNGGGSVFLCGPGDPEGFLYRGRRRADGTRDGEPRRPPGPSAEPAGPYILTVKRRPSFSSATSRGPTLRTFAPLTV